MGEGGRATFAFGGRKEAIPALIGEMMSEGLPVMEFRPQTLTMEDVFMQITQGEFGDAPAAGEGEAS